MADPREVEYVQGKLRKMKMGQMEYDHFTNGDPFTIHKGQPMGKNMITEITEATPQAKTILPPEANKTAEAGEKI